ncbi:MAG: MFS transporter [Clostridia bacterium]|nr:MFS transporter [Clostridia bacterium]
MDCFAGYIAKAGFELGQHVGVSVPRSLDANRVMAGYAILTFFVCLGSGLSGPVFALHAQSVGASFRQVGMISAAASIMHAVFSVQMGRLSDVYGAEWMFLIAASAVALSGLTYLFSGALGAVALGKAFDSLVIASFWPAMETASTAAVGAAGHSMGIIYTAYPVASFLAGAASGWISGRFGYRASFAACLAAGLVSVTGVATGKLTTSPFRRTERSSTRVRRAGSHGWPQGTGPQNMGGAQVRRGWLASRILPGSMPGFAVALTVCTTFCLMVALMWTYLPLLAEARGMGVEAVGLLVALFWAGRTIVSWPAGAASERVGRSVVMAPALALGAVGSALVVHGGAGAAMFAGVAMMGMCSGACAPVAMALGVDCVSPAHRGWALGLCENFCGIGFLVSGVVGGVLAGRHGPAAPFAATSITAGIVAVLIIPALNRGSRHGVRPWRRAGRE